MILLLHPTHRKFIRLLRDKVSKGDVTFITQEDLSEWKSVFSTSKNSKKRHQATYRILLRAINRICTEIPDSAIVINSSCVDYIERFLRKVELKNPIRTINNIIKLRFTIEAQFQSPKGDWNCTSIVNLSLQEGKSQKAIAGRHKLNKLLACYELYQVLFRILAGNSIIHLYDEYRLWLPLNIQFRSNRVKDTVQNFV